MRIMNEKKKESEEENLMRGIFHGLLTTGTKNEGQNNNADNEISKLDNLFRGIMNEEVDGGEHNKDSAKFDADDFMNRMMEQLLSKELMYEPMKQVTEKFPSWLTENEKQLRKNGEWDRRNNQYGCFRKLIEAYEEGGNHDAEGKEIKVRRLVDLMDKAQAYGQPPSEILNEIAPGLELDEYGLPKMSNDDYSTNAMPPLEECRTM